MPKPLEITALTPETLAKLLSASYRRRITTEQVQAVAQHGNLLSVSGTINLLQYTAFLAAGATHDGD